jgi:Terminase large subunit, T4likevirus-type, N-terminal
MQAHLFGPPGAWGTGLIPKDAIVKIEKSRGIADAIDFVVVKRDDGKLAKISFKSVEAGREALQGERVSLIVIDEAFDDVGVLSELLARGAGVEGALRLAATERLQQSAVIQHCNEKGEVYGISLDEVDRLSAEEKARIKASYPPNEVDSRYHGLPFRGGGGIFSVPIEDVLTDIDPASFGPEHRFLISIDPSHWGQSDQASKAGILFWANSPLAPNEWIIFREIMMRGSVNDQVGAILAAGGEGIPIAWPADGRQGMATGQTLARMFSDFPGIRMHDHWATLGPGRDGGYNMEDRLALLNKKFSDHTLKIGHQCRNLLRQYQSAEREEETGKPLIDKLDLVASMSIGIMMLRIARVPVSYLPQRRDDDHDEKLMAKPYDPWGAAVWP